MAANGLGDDIFANPERVHTGPNGFQRIDQIKREPTRIRGPNKRGKGIEEERSLPEFAEAHAQAIKDVEVPPDEVGIPNGDFDGLGQKQALRGCLGGFFHPGKHLLEENTFVGSMLVQEDKAAIRLQNDVEPTDDTDDPEWDG